MHERIFQRLAWTLAVVATCGCGSCRQGAGWLSATSQGELAYAPSELAVRGRLMPDQQRAEPTPRSPTQFVSGKLPTPTTGPCRSRGRVGEGVEEDRRQGQGRQEEGRGKMTATPGGRIHIDTAAFSQDAIDKARYNEQNGVEFRTARLAIYRRRLQRHQVPDRVRLRRQGQSAVQGHLLRHHRSAAAAEHPDRPLQGAVQPGRADQRQLHHVHGTNHAERRDGPEAAHRRHGLRQHGSRNAPPTPSATSPRRTARRRRSFRTTTWAERAPCGRRGCRGTTKPPKDAA